MKFEVYTVLFLGVLDLVILVMVIVSFFVQAFLDVARLFAYVVVVVNTVSLFIIAVYRCPPTLKCLLQFFSPNKYLECYMREKYKWDANRLRKEAKKVLEEVNELEREIKKRFGYE